MFLTAEVVTDRALSVPHSHCPGESLWLVVCGNERQFTTVSEWNIAALWLGQLGSPEQHGTSGS